MNFKKAGGIVSIFLLLSVLVYAYEEDMRKSIRVKDTTTLEISDGYYFDFIEEDIIKESNSFMGDMRYVFDGEEEHFNLRGQYRGKIEIDGGQLEYEVESFKPDYVSIDDVVSYASGDSYVEYTLTIKKRLPVYVDYWFEEDDVHGDYATIRIGGEDFYYESEYVEE